MTSNFNTKGGNCVEPTWFVSQQNEKKTASFYAANNISSFEKCTFLRNFPV